MKLIDHLPEELKTKLLFVNETKLKGVIYYGENILNINRPDLAEQFWLTRNWDDLMEKND